jgi:hypothetical protein
MLRIMRNAQIQNNAVTDFNAGGTYSFSLISGRMNNFLGQTEYVGLIRYLHAPHGY